MCGGYVTHACIVNNPSVQVARCVAAHGHTPNPAVAPHSRPARFAPPAAGPRRLSMITKERRAHSALFLRRSGITPIWGGFPGRRIPLPEGILRRDSGAPDGPAWQHGGMAWWTAGGGAGFIAARAGEGAVPGARTPSRRLPAGNLRFSPRRPILGGIMLLFLTFLFCQERRRTEGGPSMSVRRGS
jgi:hypothetical protein